MSYYDHKHYSLLVPYFEFCQAGAEDYNRMYESRHDPDEIVAALDNYAFHTKQGTAIEGGITREDIVQGKYVLPFDELADIVGSRNEVLSQLDKPFDGYLIAGGGLFDEYGPEDASYYDDRNGINFAKSKRIMQDASKALRAKGIAAPRRINWDELQTIFNSEFIKHWAEGIAFAYDDGKAPATFNLGINEVATIMAWDESSDVWTQ